MKNRFSFQDELDAHTFIKKRIEKYLKKQKAKLFKPINNSFFSTPGIVASEYGVYQKIKEGAFILSGTLYFISFIKNKKY